MISGEIEDQPKQFFLKHNQLFYYSEFQSFFIYHNDLMLLIS